MTSFTGKNNPYPHHDDGVQVRQILHKTRSIAIENFNEHFKAIFDVHGAVPTKGLLATQRFVLSAVSCTTWTYALVSKPFSRLPTIYVQDSISYAFKQPQSAHEEMLKRIKAFIERYPR